MFKLMYHPTLFWKTQEESWPGEWLGDATSIMFAQINLGKFHPFDINPPCNIGRSPHRWGYGPWWACLENTEWIAFTLILQNHFNDDLPSCHTKNIPKNWQPCCNSSIITTQPKGTLDGSYSNQGCPHSEKLDSVHDVVFVETWHTYGACQSSHLMPSGSM